MARRVLVASWRALMLSASGCAHGPEGKDLRRGRFSRLSMDEQARFRSAHDMAMRDPALAATRQRYEQARNEYRNKLREALLKADPSVQPILEKVRRHRHKDQRRQDR